MRGRYLAVRQSVSDGQQRTAPESRYWELLVAQFNGISASICSHVLGILNDSLQLEGFLVEKLERMNMQRYTQTQTWRKSTGHGGHA